MAEESFNYADYLDLDTLLSAQSPVSRQRNCEEHDEMLFIIAHQAYELWFKQLLHELDSIITILADDVLDDQLMLTLVKRLQRMITIQKVMIQQIDILNTMSSMDFLEFRHMIVNASGFQSVQFRLLEIKLGLHLNNDDYVYSHLRTKDQALITDAQNNLNLFQVVQDWLARTPFINTREFKFWDAYKESVMKALLNDKQFIDSQKQLSGAQKQQKLLRIDSTIEQFESLFDKGKYQQLLDSGERKLSHQATFASLFIYLYRHQPVLQLPYNLLSCLTEMDELLTLWRSRHVLMVQRMIGKRVGTGGSMGVAYLEKTTAYKIFDDITNMATFMLPQSDLPDLPVEVTKILGFTYSHSQVPA